MNPKLGMFGWAAVVSLNTESQREAAVKQAVAPCRFPLKPAAWLFRGRCFIMADHSTDLTRVVR